VNEVWAIDSPYEDVMDFESGNYEVISMKEERPTVLDEEILTDISDEALEAAALSKANLNGTYMLTMRHCIHSGCS
jgi:hypothetical protein